MEEKEKIIKYLERARRATRSDIARGTGLSYWRVLILVDELVKEGAIECVEVGKKRTKYFRLPLEQGLIRNS